MCGLSGWKQGGSKVEREWISQSVVMSALVSSIWVILRKAKFQSFLAIDGPKTGTTLQYKIRRGIKERVHPSERNQIQSRKPCYRGTADGLSFLRQNAIHGRKWLVFDCDSRMFVLPTLVFDRLKGPLWDIFSPFLVKCRRIAVMQTEHSTSNIVAAAWRGRYQAYRYVLWNWASPNPETLVCARQLQSRLKKRRFYVLFLAREKLFHLDMLLGISKATEKYLLWQKS